MKDLLRRHEPVVLAAASALFFGFLLIQGDHLLDIDLYFHIRIADLLRQRGYLARLPWMTQAIHADRYVDYHFLYHWLLVPFVVVSPNLIVAAKLATVVFSALSVGAFVLLLKRREVGSRWLWVLFLLLCSPIFTGRLLFGRGVTLFLGIFFLFVLFYEQRRHWLLFALAAVSVWTYQAFPLLAVYAGLRLVADGLRHGRWDLRTAGFVFAGIVAAFVFHPSFPAQFRGYWLELVVHARRPPGLEPIGEWLPANAAVTMTGLAVPVAAWTLALLLGGTRGERTGEGDAGHNGTAGGSDAGTGDAGHNGTDCLRTTLLGLCLVSLFSMTLSLKPIEYLVPLVVLYVATAPWERVPERARRLLGATVIAGGLLWGMPQLVDRIGKQFDLLNPAPELEAGRWLAANTEQGAIVMLPWGQFPEVFFVNTHNRYLWGLNPVYAYGKDRETYLALRAFFEGRTPDPMSVVRRVGAGYSMLSRTREAITIRLLQAASQPIVYQSAEYVILAHPEATGRP